MSEAPTATPLLKPTEALRRGFEFDGQAPVATALAHAYHTSLGSGHSEDQALPREGFVLGHLGLTIRYEDGSELSDMPATYRLPNAPDWFVGIANLHGLLVPVFDLALYLGIEHRNGVKPMLLVLGHGPDSAGIVIDGLPVRLRLRPADRAEGAPVPAALDGCVSETYWAADSTWIDLQVGALLGKLTEELAAAGL